jgi:HK97 family phage portal protein
MGLIEWARSRFPREQKSNPAYLQYQEYGGLPQPVQMQANPKAFMKEGYRRNDTVHKCVSYAARNAAGIRLALYTDATKKREITSHPLLDLLLHPNKDMSGNDYVESVCAYTLLIGNSYQYALQAFKSGPPDELWVLRPDMINIVPSRRGIVRYDYKINEPAVGFEPSSIGHTKFWNPDDDLYGLSPVEVAGIFVDMNLAYRKWNLALTQNMAQPPGAWVTPALLGKKERETLEQNVNKKYNGFKNAGKAPVLDGGLKFESYMVPPAQMAFLEGQGYNSAQTANIYNLAPQVIGDTSASTYDNFEQAVYGSYTECIFPLMDKVSGTWNRWLVPMYPDLKNAVLGYDKQSVETIQKVMQAQESAKADRWTKIYLAGGCTLATYQEKIGIPSDPQGNVYRIKDLIIPADKLEEYAEQCLTAPAEPPMPVPEGTPPPGTTVEGTVTHPSLPAIPAPKPKLPAPKKSMDKDGVYQPDDLASQLSLLKGQGVSQVEWKTLTRNGNGTCDTCIVNAGEIRELGQPFSSGHILPPAHPNCECSVAPVEKEVERAPRKMYDFRVKRDLSDQEKAREQYREFMRRLG